MEIELFPLEERHIESVAGIEKLCFSDPWSARSFFEELFNENAHFFVCAKNGEVVGFAGFYTALDEGYIANIAVHPGFRKQGIGGFLVKSLIGDAVKRKLKFLTLEVRRSNQGAISLYQKYGFIICGERRGFYERPKEDALLMTLLFGDGYENTRN